MILNIGRHEIHKLVYSELSGHGEYLFKLADYPNISANELKLAVEFILYEKSYNRETEIVCDDELIISTITNAIANPESIERFHLPDTTEFVYHVSDLNGARGILSSGKLLSAVKIHNKTGKVLAYERRESPWSDPADFYEYIMFCNGDDMTGDYVVLSDNFPSDEDLEKGNFNAGVRFYIRSDAIVRHPGHAFDGYHPVKVRDEIILSEYLYACIVPEQYRTELEHFVLPELAEKVHYLSQSGLSISEWNEKVYSYLKIIQRSLLANGYA